MTAVKHCAGRDCVSAYQDQKNGKDNRVCNSCDDGWRCTVCGRTIGGSKLSLKTEKPVSS